ncbi:MAG TPA: LamG-like jellyroll fold domain-containing protein [Verrucomicrobiae bacterium]|nr:LamG-like jellyroll fold domain-containing protein [Verrucomicrobiae bacterium]
MKSLGKLTPGSLLRRPLLALAFIGAAASSHAVDYPSTILADHPSAYYRLEEPMFSTVASDSSPNATDAYYVYNGENTSPLLGQAGIDTNSILFNGGGSDYGYVDIPASGLVQPVAQDGTSSGAFTAELWVEPTAFPSTWSVPIEVAQYPNGWNIYISGPDAGNGNTAYFYLDMRPSVFAGAANFPIQYQHWYHLVVTFDGANANFYINGVANGPYTATGFVPAIGADVHIGSGQGVGWTPALAGVDEVAFYTNVLTPTQIQSHYAIGTNSFRPTFFGPSVLTDPVSQSVYSGLPATFTVGASGTQPLHYQWLKNGSPVGTDSSSVTINAQYPADDASSFQVVITNNYGATTSAVATLSVLTGLNMISPPNSITRNVGSYAAFHVTANGAVPITYGWTVTSNGVTQSIPGATNATLWLTNVTLGQNGNVYTANVTNPFTSSSAGASLTVQARTDPAVSLTGYGAIVAADKPVAYWRMDESTGSSIAIDAVGSFDGTYTPGTGSITYGVPGGVPHSADPAITLAGGATVQIPFAPELNPDTAWSVETWVQPSSIGANGGDYRVVLSSQYNLYPNPYNGWYLYQQPNNTFAFVPQPANGFIVAGPDDPAHTNNIVAGKWYHVVITDDLTSFVVYINGEAIAGAPVSAVPFVPNGDGINLDGSAGLGGADQANFVIGQRDDVQFGTFLGSVDETAVYKYALSASQIAHHYADAATLTISTSGGNLTFTYPVGVLQQSTNVASGYTDVPGASSGYSVAPTGPQEFYRIHVP